MGMLLITIVRRASSTFLAALIIAGGASFLSSEQFTMTSTYPIPAAIYNQIVTIGNNPAADTTLSRNAGNTILVPATNAAGMVGIGTATPASKLSVAGGVQPGNDAAACTAAKAGTLRWSGDLKKCNGVEWRTASGPEEYSAGYLWAYAGCCTITAGPPNAIVCRDSASCDAKYEKRSGPLLGPTTTGPGERTYSCQAPLGSITLAGSWPYLSMQVSAWKCQ